MTATRTIGKARLYHSDCMTILGDYESCVDAVCADPPYGIDYQSARRTDKEKRFLKIQNDKRPFIWFLYDAFNCLKDTGCIFCFCRWDVQQAFISAMEWAGFTVKSSIVWDRGIHGMGDLKAAFAPCHDIILFGIKKQFKFVSDRPRDIISIQRLSGDQLVHPNEKPVALIELLLQYVIHEGAVILDPFMGSGSTGVAATRLGCEFIGIEKDLNYFNLSCQRIEAAQNQPYLFSQAKVSVDQAIQNNLFDGDSKL